MRTFNTDDNGDRNENHRRGSSPHQHHQQQQRRVFQPQDEIAPQKKNFQNNRYQQSPHHNFNQNNNNHGNNGGNNNSNRPRKNSIDQNFNSRKGRAIDDRKSREGGGGGFHAGGFNHNHNNNNNNNRFRQTDHDDHHANNRHHNNQPYNGGNRGRQLSPKRSNSNSSTSSHNHFRGNNFKSPTPDSYSPRDRSRTPQVSPGRRQSQNYGRRDDRDSDYHGYRRSRSPSHEQDIFDNRKRRRSLSPINTEAQNDSYPKGNYNPYPYPAQEITAGERGKAPLQEFGSREYADYPPGAPSTSVNPSQIGSEQPLDPQTPLPTLDSLSTVLPLLMQLQQQQQLALQQPQFALGAGVIPPFPFQIPPPPFPPLPPIPPAIGGQAIVPGNPPPIPIPPQPPLPGNQFTIASATIPPATRTTMTTVPEAARADPTKLVKENNVGSTSKNNVRPSDPRLAAGRASGNQDSNGFTNKEFKKEPRSEEPLSNSHTSLSQASTSSKGAGAISPIKIKPEDTTVYPNMVGSQQIKQEQDQSEQERALLSSQSLSGPQLQNIDSLAAILSDPLTARLLETIQPFLAQKAPTSNSTSSETSNQAIDSTSSVALDPKQGESLVALSNNASHNEVVSDTPNAASSTVVSETRESNDSIPKSGLQQDQVDQALAKNGDDERTLGLKEGKQDSVRQDSPKREKVASDDVKVPGTDTERTKPVESDMSQETVVSSGFAPPRKSKTSKDTKLSRVTSLMGAEATPTGSDMDISSDEENNSRTVTAQPESTRENLSTIVYKDPIVKDNETSSTSTEKTANDASKVDHHQDIENVEVSVIEPENKAGKLSSNEEISKSVVRNPAESEPVNNTCDMDVDVPEVNPASAPKPTASMESKSSVVDGQSEDTNTGNSMKRRKRSTSSPSLSSQISASNLHQQHSYPNKHFIPGSDIALLSKMAASNADLNRFRRESEWLEERVRRPKRDTDSENVLDKVLGLTRNVPHLNQENRGRSNSGGSGNGVVDSGASAVRLSSESRVAFSILKTNLLSDLEEQTRLETDYQTLQRALERMQVKIVEKQKMQQEAEHQIQEVVNRQSELELELERVREQEAECLRQREIQRKQAEEEIQRLEATLRQLQQQQKQQKGQEHQVQNLLQA
ncbi:hypothetical protein BGZ49_007582 [Haplosporangium sp. Z 27]|nr:hypothetical protein BGZ49_007582 [Haplosporangium sp. Z 27]